jgi:hypothetical protein
LIRDRDPLFTGEFIRLLADSGVEAVRLPSRSPNLNAHAERFVRTIRESCLKRLILFGERALRNAIHYASANTTNGVIDAISFSSNCRKQSGIRTIAMTVPGYWRSRSGIVLRHRRFYRVTDLSIGTLFLRDIVLAQQGLTVKSRSCIVELSMFCLSSWGRYAIALSSHTFCLVKTD